MSYLESLRALNLNPRRFAQFRVAPVAAGGLLVAALGTLLLGGRLPAGLGAAPAVLGLGAIVAVLAWPVIEVDRRRRQIDDALPFFMTHFGVLSTSNLPRIAIIQLLAKKKEYKALSVELNRIHDLVTNWNLSLPDAARQVGGITPSRLFSDLLERLAYALESGQVLEDFLRAEQAVVLREYSSFYENALYRIESWKDMYLSAVMSGAFFVIFATIMPVLTGGDPVALLLGSLGLLFFLEVLLAVLLQARLPRDRLAHTLPVATRESRRIERTLQFTFPVAAAAAFAGYIFAGTAVGLLAAAAPLVVAGIILHLDEGRIKRREENYPAFIRSLGAAVEARGGSLVDVLRAVRAHDFGPLTQVLDRLHRRLWWRIDDQRAWSHFNAETGSYLVDAFNGMFVEAVGAGGKAGAIGEIISDNVVRILGLRTGRYSAAGTFRGLVYSLTGTMAFVMFMGLGILTTLSAMFSAASSDVATENLPFSLSFGAQESVMRDIMYAILAVHAIIAGVLIKMGDGGRLSGASLHVGLLLILGVGVGWASDAFVPNLF